MTTNEIITTLLEYDGWEYESEEWDGMYKIGDAFWYKDDEEIESMSWEQSQKYLTDLNILHRVAVKVMHELIDSPCHDDISDLTDRCSNIHFALLKEPINGEYITLATATADAIVYLKKYKV